MVHLAHPITTRLQASYLQNGTLKLTTKLTESEARTAFSGEQVKLACTGCLEQLQGGRVRFLGGHLCIVVHCSCMPACRKAQLRPGKSARASDKTQKCSAGGFWF